MTMGTGVVLFVIGAILAFAVKVETSVISLSTAGMILMVAGAVVFVIGLVLTLRGRRTITTSRVADPSGAPLESQRVTRSSDSTQL